MMKENGKGGTVVKNDAGSKKSGQDSKLRVETLQLTGPARLLSAGSGEGCLFMVLSGSGVLHGSQGPGRGVGGIDSWGPGVEPACRLSGEADHRVSFLIEL